MISSAENAAPPGWAGMPSCAGNHATRSVTSTINIAQHLPAKRLPE
jgi:hypothetical protein